jgi:hypothetical protein
MRTPRPRTAIGLGSSLVLSLGLLTGCAASASAPAVAPGATVSDRVREGNACVRASIGQNDDGFIVLPFAVDRDAYRRCMETHGYPRTPRGSAAEGEPS